MCLCIFAIDQHPEFPFILLANRDEFRNRPAAKATFWDDHSHVLAGRDLKQMGTWLGVTTNGKIAFLTNHRDPKLFNRPAPSRGALVSNFLTGNSDANNYLHSIQKPEVYNGFNLIVGSPRHLSYLSNVEESIFSIEPGIHGLSNAFLNSGWPKSETGKEALAVAIEQDQMDIDSLFEILGNTQKPSDDRLPQTGVGLELERTLSPLFINTPEYGTVCSTVIKVDRYNRFYFEERSYNSLGVMTTQVAHEFEAN